MKYKIHCKKYDSGFFTGFAFSIGKQSLYGRGITLVIWEWQFELGWEWNDLSNNQQD